MNTVGSSGVYLGALPGKRIQIEKPDTSPRVEAVHKDNSSESERLLRQLQADEQQVMKHIQSHRSIGGQYIRGQQLFYVDGPGNERLISEGEVSFNTSPINNNPQATLLKSQVLKAAAMAPAELSPQDQSVIRRSAQLTSQSISDLVKLQRKENTSDKAERNEDESENKTKDKPKSSEPAAKPLKESLFIRATDLGTVLDTIV